MHKEKYIQLCKTEDSIPVFLRPFWLDTVCGEEQWDVILYEKNTRIIAALPYYIENKFGLRYITQPPFTQISGPWIKYPHKIKQYKKLSLEKEVMNHFIVQLEKLPICFYQQKFSYKITNWLPFFWRGYKQTTRYTYIIEDIKDLDTVYKNFHSSKKRNIKQALKHDLQIGFDLPAREFYENHRYTLKKKGKIISYPYNLFERIYNAAYLNNSGKVIYAKGKNGELHSALFVIWDLNSAYNLISTIDPDHVSSRSSTLLVSEIICFLSDKTKSYDFEGSMDQFIEYSYSKFGTIQTPYFSLWKTYTKNPFLKLLLFICDVKGGSHRLNYLKLKFKSKFAESLE